MYSAIDFWQDLWHNNCIKLKYERLAVLNEKNNKKIIVTAFVTDDGTLFVRRGEYFVLGGECG